MKFKATEEQFRRMCALAINASCPVGLGFLHFRQKNYTPDDVPADALQYGIDYHDGRMVKLWVHPVAPGEYECPDDQPRSDYQSWSGRYPKWTDLLAAAGII